MSLLIPVSWGELVDKLTILELKLARIADPAALVNVRHEHDLLRAIAAPALDDPALAAPVAALRAVNAMLWEIEDAIRRHEARGDFGEGFVALARAVYRRNDERAAIKRAINTALGFRELGSQGGWQLRW